MNRPLVVGIGRGVSSEGGTSRIVAHSLRANIEKIRFKAVFALVLTKLALEFN